VFALSLSTLFRTHSRASERVHYMGLNKTTFRLGRQTHELYRARRSFLGMSVVLPAGVLGGADNPTAADPPLSLVVRS
jgi:hypothetical protein